MLDTPLLYETMGAIPETLITPYILSKPKFNQQLNWTEFEVRLHSYTVIHPTPPTHTNYLLLLLTAPASQAGRLYNYTVRDQLAALYDTFQEWKNISVST